MFSQYRLDGDGESPHKVPKLNHKKSRLGCTRCRARRVKCNEAKPVCHNCERHHAKCIYDRVPPKEQNGRSSNSSASHEAERAHGQEISNDSPTSLDFLDDKDPPESKSRRMLEARLMHQYVTTTGLSIAIDEKTQPLFAVLIPSLSFKSDALLYSMYSVSAIHLYLCNVDQTLDAMNVHRTYLAMALREHKQEVAKFNRFNFELVCLTSHLLRICAFAMLRIRNREPYSPPVEWMLISGTMEALFIKAQPLIADDPQHTLAQMMRSTPVIFDLEERFGVTKREGWEHLLERDVDDLATESWDSEIQDAYETTLSYIGGVAAVIKDPDQPLGEAQRRLILFPILVKKRFAKLVEEQQPRAMVVLAYFFALLTVGEEVWWVGTTGRDEVRAIARALSGKWRSMLEWPLQMIEEGLGGIIKKV